MKNPAWDNLESRNEIRKAAFLLFRKIGYKTTSYSMIAEESKQGRPLVQYYYPKKEEIALEFLVEAMQTILSQLESDRQADAMVATLHFGQLYYTFLLYDEDMQRFTSEVLESRSVTSRLVQLNAKWSLPESGTAEDEERITSASIRATGGVYELLYLQLQDGSAKEPAEYAVRNVADFYAATGTATYDETLRHLEENLLPDKQVEEYMKSLFQTLF